MIDIQRCPEQHRFRVTNVLTAFRVKDETFFDPPKTTICRLKKQIAAT